MSKSIRTARSTSASEDRGFVLIVVTNQPDVRTWNNVEKRRLTTSRGDRAASFPRSTGSWFASTTTAMIAIAGAKNRECC